MKARIAQRVGRIITGSVHAVVDAIEGVAPEAVMEQAIREVDSAIEEVRHELGCAQAARHNASRRLAERNEEHDKLLDGVTVALEESRNDLAEVAVGRQLDIEAQIPVIEETITDSIERETELESYIAALNGKRREMQKELDDFRLLNRKAESGAPANGDTPNPAAEQKVANAAGAFERVLSRHGISVTDSGAASSAQLAELESLSRSNRIKERLAEIQAAS